MTGAQPRSVERALELARKTADRVRLGRDFVLIDRDDLRQEAAIGAVQAMASYDPARGASWETWVIQKARSHVLEAMRQADPLTRGDRQRCREEGAELPVRYVSIDTLLRTSEADGGEGGDRNLLLAGCLGVEDPRLLSLPDRLDARRQARLALKAYLTAYQRKVVLLHALKGMTHREVAAALGRDKSAVARAWQDARERMRRKLKDEIEEGGAG